MQSLDATELLAPKGICASDNGRYLFVCDTGHHKIKFAALPANSALFSSAAERLAGVELFPFAGTGKKAWRDGPVHDCSFNSPAGICQCADGTLTVADTGNHCIRQIVRTSAGALLVRTIAGGYISVRDSSSSSEYVEQLERASHTELPRLRTRIAGYRDGRRALFRSPSAVIEGLHSTLLVADTMNNCIRALRPSRDRRSPWDVTTVCGAVSGGYVDGSCEGAMFRQPVGLSLGPHGSFFVSDRGNCCIRQVGGCVAQLSGRARDSTAYTWVRTIEIGVVPRSVLSGSSTALAECMVERLGEPLGVLFTGTDGTNAALLVCDGGNNVIECLAFDDAINGVVARQSPRRRVTDAAGCSSSVNMNVRRRHSNVSMASSLLGALALDESARSESTCSAASDSTSSSPESRQCMSSHTRKLSHTAPARVHDKESCHRDSIAPTRSPAVRSSVDLWASIPDADTQDPMSKQESETQRIVRCTCGSASALAEARHSDSILVLLCVLSLSDARAHADHCV